MGFLNLDNMPSLGLKFFLSNFLPKLLKGSDDKYSSSRLEMVSGGPNGYFLFTTQAAEDESNLIFNYLLLG